MKKIDLHIHTVPTVSDAHFDFSLEKLKEYINMMEIDCIAITNHNLFDKTQFDTISSSLGITTLPGIEINLENGHILLISENKELDDFKTKCSLVQAEITSSTDFITVSKLEYIFPDLSKYLLIPHYDKKPIIRQEVIDLLRDFISAGEVTSVRKFKACMKEPGKLVPVIFSDMRFFEALSSFSTRQTYLGLEEISFNGIRSCLFDKSKVFLSRDDGNELFQVTDDGIKISTGLNVVIGERSTGKTYILNKICNSFENVKHIKQFSLLQDQDDEEKFENVMRQRHSRLSENFLKEFKETVEDVVKIDLKQNEIDVEKYISTLLKFANENDKADTFSKAALFSEILFTFTPQDSLKKLIDSTKTLIENTEYRDIINRHVTLQDLKKLALDLISKFNETEEMNLKKKWLNELISNIKDELKFRTTNTSPENIDLYRIAIDRKKVDKFEQLVSNLKVEREIDRKEIRGFKIVARLKNFTGASQLQWKSKSRQKFVDAFEYYHSPYKYLQCLKEKALEETELYKYFVDIEYKTLNKHGFPVSGGERSEFNLLHEISDALKHDILLLDEPESSFDNLFLKNEVNELIKDIAKQIPVIVVTHNSTVGASIKPDYILYTEKKLNGILVEYYVYTGYPANKELKCSNGMCIPNFNVMLNCLEAGPGAYEERRKENYEILKD
jgi:ABC-type dipeptide/oligopeptide/nickel transport system ATPase subunit